MPRTLVSSRRLFPQAPYHAAAVAGEGSLVVTAGACPLDAAGTIVSAGDLAAQTRQALTNLTVALAEAGARPDDVIKTTIYVATATREDLLTVWTEYTAVYGENGPPSTLLGVSVLGWPGQLVEVEAIAIRPPSRPQDGTPRARGRSETS